MFNRRFIRTSSLDRVSAGTRWSLETIRKMIAKSPAIKDDVRGSFLNIESNIATVWVFGKPDAFFSVIKVSCKLNWYAGSFIVTMTISSVNSFGKVVSTGEHTIFSGQSSNQETTDFIVSQILKLSAVPSGLMSANENRLQGNIAEDLLGY